METKNSTQTDGQSQEERSAFRFLRRFSPRNVIEIVKRELKSGTSPEKLTLSVVVGAGVGVFPLIGTTMTICGILGVLLRLNPVSIQLANYLVYPLQILLIFPFLKSGSTVSGVSLDLTWAEDVSAENLSEVAKGIFDVAGFAVLGWLVWVPAASFTAYWILLPFIKKAGKVLEKKKIQ